MLRRKEELNGKSLYQPNDFPPTPYPLFYPGLNQSDIDADRYCTEALQNITEVKGKIVVCELGAIPPISKGTNVKAASGVSMIIINSEAEGYTTQADAHVLPATNINYVDQVKLIAYINSTTSPVATISFKGTIIGDSQAPAVAYFSSRGPSFGSPGILKPDIIGPGVNVLPAYHQSVENKTTRNPSSMYSRALQCLALISAVSRHYSKVHIPIGLQLQSSLR